MIFISFVIKSLSELSEEQLETTGKIFMFGFGHMFKRLSKDNISIQSCFTKSFVKSLFYVALDDTIPVGFIAISNNKIRPIKLARAEFSKKFGKFTSLVFCSQISMIMEKPEVKEDYECYIDLLAVSPEYQNRGIATSLLRYVHTNEDYDDFYIEVLSNNTKAKNLYKKVGYKTMEIKKNIIMKIQGLGDIERMKLTNL